MIWIGSDPAYDMARELRQRDLFVAPGSPSGPPWRLDGVRAAVFAPIRGAETDVARALEANARRLFDDGIGIEVLANDDVGLSRFLGNLCTIPRHGSIRYRVGAPPFRVAEEIARHDPGPAPRPDLVIDMGENQQPLSARDEPLFRRAFGDCTRIVLVELGGGRSNARVFAVYETLAGSHPGVRPQPSFAKLDESAKIEREFRNYRQHADRYIPFGLRPNVRGVVGGWDRSLLVGDFVDRSESLWDLARRGVATQPLHSLVTETLSGWRDQGYAKEPVTGSVARALADRSVVDPLRIRPDYAELAGTADAPDAVWERLTSLETQSFRTAPFHGDLHGENVRVRNGQAILIDLASVAMDGPLTTDIAALETWIAFELPPEDAPNEFRNAVWKEEVERLYSPGSFMHPPGPCDPTCRYHGTNEAVRQLRRMGIAAQSCPTEYQAAVATLLLRRCQWPPSSAADRFRRATGYGIAAGLARHLEGARR